MATLPMTPDAGMQPGGAPMDPAGAAPDDGSGGGYEICIKVGGNGQISVGVDQDGAAAAGAPGMAPTEDDSNYQPVNSIRDAMEKALEIYRANGQQPDGTDDENYTAGVGGQDGAA